jgi:hypothetical protein
LTELVLRNPEYPPQSVEINGKNATLSFGGISNEIENFSTMKEKELLKQAEKLLRSFNISMKEYGEPQITRNDEFYINIFYPFLFQEKYPIWEVVMDEPLGMEVIYEIRTNTFSIRNINISKYEYANYPTLPKEEILKDFTIGMKKLNAPEVVYLMKVIDGESYYVP